MVIPNSKNNRFKQALMRIFGKQPKTIIFNTILYLLFVLFLVSMLSPFLYVLVVSFQQKIVEGATSHIVFGLGAYEYVFGNVYIVRAFLNTIGAVIAGTLAALAITMSGAYALSKTWLRGRKVLLIFVLITMLFSGGLIPFYLLIKSLGLRDSYLVYICVGAVSAFNVFIVKNFYQGISLEMEESAKIDGANEFQIFYKIYLPLSKAIIATIALWVAVAKWNDYMTGLLYIDDKSKLLIQNVLRNMLVTASSTSGVGGDSNALSLSEAIKMAAVVVALVPIICVYPFVQKYFTKGVMLGALKG